MRMGWRTGNGRWGCGNGRGWDGEQGMGTVCGTGRTETAAVSASIFYSKLNV